MVEGVKADLIAAFDSLLAATAGSDQVARHLLDPVGALARDAAPAVVESLPTRARVVMRLLREGFVDPAWLVLIDSATGVVDREFRATTSSGAARANWPLPILTSFEAPHVYAQLPGFRDPRYGAPDALYEIGAAMKLKCHVDDVVPGRRPVFAGWAALDVVDTEPDESVVLIARHEGVEVRWRGARHRRADQVGGARETLRRRAWSGWSAEISPADLTAAGRWTLWLEIGQQGLSRRVRIGRSASEIAARTVGSPLSQRPPVSLVQGDGGWSVSVAAQRRR